MGRSYSKGAMERMAPNVKSGKRAKVKAKSASPADARKAGGPPTVSAARAPAKSAKKAGEGRNANAARRNAAINDAVSRVKRTMNRKR